MNSIIPLLLSRYALLAFSVCYLAAAVAPPAPAPVPRFQNRAEYNLAAEIQNAKDPVRRFSLLNQWRELYPNSAFQQERFNQLIKLCRQLGKHREMLALARNMAAQDPYGLGNYWITILTISLEDTSPGALEQGRRAAETVLKNSGKSFAPGNCPNAVALSEWFKERDHQRIIAHRSLGWIALQQKQFVEAEREFAIVLKSNRNDAEASFWQGCALLGENKPELSSQVLYYVARSLVITGKESLQPEARPLVASYLKEAYTAYHGDDKELDKLLRQARSGIKPR